MERTNLTGKAGTRPEAVRVKITADSTCDLAPEILEKYNITLCPLTIVCVDSNQSEREFRDGIDITPADLFKMVDTEKKICKTAAPNIFDYEKIFAEYSPKYDSVVHISISQGFSSSYQNACIAADEFRNVRVVNSFNLSTGSGYLVHQAGIMAEEGKSAEEICTELGKIVLQMNCSFIIDRLDYLHKGGRCSLAKLIASKVLNIKPCIEVADGVMRVGAKYTGKFEQVLEKYVKDRLTAAKGNIDLKRVYVTHTMCSPEVVEMVRGEIVKYADFEEIIETRAGCTVSNHCGPNTLGIIFRQIGEYK